MSKTLLFPKSARDTTRAGRRDEARAEYVSFGALLAEVLDTRANDPDVLGYVATPPQRKVVRPKSAA